MKRRHFLTICVAVLLYGQMDCICYPQGTTTAYVQTGWIRGQVHDVFNGFDLPLKQVPVYLISANDDFASSYLKLRKQILPLLDAKEASKQPSSEWINATKAIIEIEKQRMALFRKHIFRTVYADNQGLFVFHDVPPGGYSVFIEGTIKNQMVIWEAPVSLGQGEDMKLDLGSHNVGDTRVVYSWSGKIPQGKSASGEMPHRDVNPPAVSNPSSQQEDAAAEFDRGWAYARGDGVAQDFAEAAKWFRKAAEQGNAAAQHNLGFLYEKGEGVQKNSAEALKWYKKAAEQGLAEAQYSLGCLYSQGDGVTQDFAEGAKWFRKGAEQGNADAQSCLGACYANGEGVQKNLTEAVKWIRKAAEQGDSAAQYNLGISYANGEGVQKNSAEAARWMKKSAEQGQAEAKSWLESQSQEQLAREQEANIQNYIKTYYPTYVGAYNTAQEAASAVQLRSTVQQVNIDSVRASQISSGGGSYVGNSRVGRYTYTYDKNLNLFIVYQQ